MNTKKWLALGLSVALAATAALAACAPEQPKEPDEGDKPTTPHTHTFTKWDHSDTEHWLVCPDDGELDVSSRAPHKVDKATHTCKCGYEEPHTHSYTAWKYNILQHWKVCPDDKAIGESTRGSHNYVEGVCEECGRKEPEVYVYGLSIEAFGYSGIWCNMSDIKAKKDKWVKMELGDDGKYTADIYFAAGDTFAVADIASSTRYPAVENPDRSEGALQIEAANTYTVTLDPADGSVTFAVHAHTYVWKYDANNHWKVCSTKDQTVDESSRGAHSYDPDTHACVCGAVETVSCDHSKGYAFHYEELPAAEADGGTLQKTCPDCHDAQDVPYAKGFTGDATMLNKPTSTIGDISEEGTYYFTTGNKYQTLGLKITEAGTYTLTFEEVCDLSDGQLGLVALMFGKAYALMFSMPTSCVYNKTVSSVKKQDLTDYAVKVNEKNVAVTNDIYGNLVTLSFTVTDEQLQAGDLYVTIHLGGFTNNNHSSPSSADSLSHLVTVKKD